MLIDFEEAKARIETKRNAAADILLQQQDWLLEAEVRLKKRDYIILLFIIDCLIGLVAIMM